MKTLICAATGFEAKACRAGLGKADGVTVLQTGVGLKRAHEALEAWIAKNGRPDLIVSSGFAGCFDPSVEIGSWVVARDVYLWPNPPEGVAIHIAEDAGKGLDGIVSALPGMYEGIAISAPMIVEHKWRSKLKGFEADEKKIILDMESAALAEVAKRNAVRFVVVRLITDTPKKALPKFVYEFSNALDLTNEAAARARWQSIVRGTRQVVRNPRRTGSFLKESIGWGKDLSAGWRLLSKAIV